MKFTFRTTKATGRFKSFQSDSHEIKLKRKVVGSVSDKDNHEIGLMIIKDDMNEDGNPNCSWKWITLKKKSNSVQEAKDFLNKNIDEILKKWNLH